MAFADIDNDGDQDVFIEMGGAYPGDAAGNALFENPGFDNRWINVRLIGQQSNRSAIGARIRVDFKDEGNERTVFQWVNSGGSFGCKPLRREIGLGRADHIDVLEVFWPTSGQTQRFTNVPVNQFIEITEGASNWKARASRSFSFARRQGATGP